VILLAIQTGARDPVTQLEEQNMPVTWWGHVSCLRDVSFDSLPIPPSFRTFRDQETIRQEPNSFQLTRNEISVPLKGNSGDLRRHSDRIRP
jgi:hypothetical protein